MEQARRPVHLPGQGPGPAMPACSKRESGRICTLRGLCSKNVARVMCIPVEPELACVGATTVEDDAEDEMPEGDQDDRADQGAEKWNRRRRGDIVISDARNDDDLSHQPDADQGRDDRANKAQRGAPAEHGFSRETYHCRNGQIDNEIQADIKTPGVIANSDGDATCQYQT